jgi:hypothetical protein
LTVSLPDIAATGPMQLWTHIHGSDAMFLALIRKPAV